MILEKLHHWICPSNPMKLRKQLSNDMPMNIGQAPVDAVVAYMS